MKIAIIAGSGDFPIQIANQNPEAFVLCIEDHSTPSSFKNNSEIVSLINPSDWISKLKKHKVTHLVMAGKIDRISNGILVSVWFIEGLAQSQLLNSTATSYREKCHVGRNVAGRNVVASNE